MSGGYIVNGIELTSGGGGGTHGSGTLAARPVSPTAGDTWAVTSGEGEGDGYTCYVAGTWQPTTIARRMPLDASVVHRWPLDEGTGTSFADDGTGGNDLTLTGSGVVVDGAGVIGCGLRFTGTSALAATASSPATPDPAAFSIALTFRHDAQNGDQYPMVKLVDPGAWTPNEAAFAVKFEYGTLFIGHNVGGWRVHAILGVSITIGVLYRLLAVFNGAVWRVYLNGILVDEWAAAGAVTWGTGEWVFGGIPTVSVPFHGLVDEPAVFDAVLTPAQVAEDYLRTHNLYSL